MEKAERRHYLKMGFWEEKSSSAARFVDRCNSTRFGCKNFMEMPSLRTSFFFMQVVRSFTLIKYNLI